MIKSARVMKKAVGHLIPFMEEERLAKEAELKIQGIEITEAVHIYMLLSHSIRCNKTVLTEIELIVCAPFTPKWKVLRS